MKPSGIQLTWTTGSVRTYEQIATPARIRVWIVDDAENARQAGAAGVIAIISNDLEGIEARLEKRA